MLAEKSFGLSLSDRYWLNDEDDAASWNAVNFFDNDFADDLGFLTLGQDSAGSSPDAPDYRTVNLSSPNGTLGGDLLKKWKIMNGERVLLKSGVGAFNQEPYNEVAATALHRRLMEPGEFTPYTLFEDGRRVYSACPEPAGARRGTGGRLGRHPQREAAEQLVRSALLREAPGGSGA